MHLKLKANHFYSGILSLAVIARLAKLLRFVE